jgi:hypothetical protein
MANLAITAATVVKGSQSGDETVVAGATIARGDACYLDPTDDSKAKLCDANAVASSFFKGIALNDAADEQPLTLWTSGNLGLGAILSIGEVYVVSATAGKIAVIGDLLSGEYVTLIGVGSTTSNLQAIFHETGVAKA